MYTGGLAAVDEEGLSADETVVFRSQSNVSSNLPCYIYNERASGYSITRVFFQIRSKLKQKNIIAYNALKNTE